MSTLQTERTTSARTRMITLLENQFTQTDPMPYGPGTAFESSYVYGYNNPLMYVDPSGERGQLQGCARFPGQTPFMIW